MLRKIAWALIIALAVIIGFGVLMPEHAYAERVPSVSINELYRLRSENMWLSDAPNNLVLYDILRIDIDKTADKLEGDLFLPLVPEDLEDIILFDGYHVAHFKFERVNEGCVHISLDASEIADFDGTVALFLFVTGYDDL